MPAVLAVPSQQAFCVQTTVSFLTFPSPGKNFLSLPQTEQVVLRLSLKHEHPF